MVITGCADDPRARRLEEAAQGVYRLAKAVIRVTPETLSRNGLAPALEQTIPSL